MENSNFETGASNHRINNFILTLDSTREAREKLNPVLYKVFKQKNTFQIAHLENLILIPLREINGTLKNADTLTHEELCEAAMLYRLEAFNSIENDF